MRRSGNEWPAKPPGTFHECLAICATAAHTGGTEEREKKEKKRKRIRRARRKRKFIAEFAWKRTGISEIIRRSSATRCPGANFTNASRSSAKQKLMLSIARDTASLVIKIHLKLIIFNSLKDQLLTPIRKSNFERFMIFYSYMYVHSRVNTLSFFIYY